MRPSPCFGRLDETFGDRLSLRIGVNTGEVALGRAREGSSFVTGDAVNVAARLEQAAEPGEVLVGERTARAVRGAFEFGAPTAVEARGKPGWNLIALDLGVDTSTPAGEMMASVLATFAQFERRLIGQRTKDALAVKRAQGVVLGRPREIPGSTITRIRELHDAGLGLVAIARKLNEEGIETPRNGKWHHGGVGRVLSWELRS